MEVALPYIVRVPAGARTEGLSGTRLSVASWLGSDVSVLAFVGRVFPSEGQSSDRLGMLSSPASLRTFGLSRGAFAGLALFRKGLRGGVWDSNPSMELRGGSWIRDLRFDKKKINLLALPVPNIQPFET